MQASANIKPRNLRLGLLAGVLALTLWGAALFTHLQSSSDLTQRPAADWQMAGPGGGSGTGG